MSVVVIMLVSILSYVVTQVKFSTNRVEREKAFQIAEAGIYYYRWYLAHATNGMNAQQLRDFWQGGGAIGAGGPEEFDFTEPGPGDVIGKYRIELDPPDANSTIAHVTSTGWTERMPEVKRKIKVRFRRPSWSEYALVSNSYLHLTDDSEVFGKLHSNYGIWFDGVAHNVVSSLPATFDDPDRGGSNHDFGVHTSGDPLAPTTPWPWPDGTVPSEPNIFKGGRQFPVPEVNFPSINADLGFMKTQAQSPGGSTINDCTTTGCYFDSTGEGRHIILKGDKFDICTVDSHHHTQYNITKYRQTDGSGTCNSCAGSCISNHNIPDDGIIFVEDSAWVEGSVNGKRITIAAADISSGPPADIFIGYSNIRYSGYDCDNSIALIGQRDIKVIKDVPSEFIVDGALVAHSGQLRIDDNGTSLHSFTVNGSVASYLEPVLNHGNNGFGIRIFRSDNNLTYCPPSYYPIGSEYSIDQWQEL